MHNIVPGFAFDSTPTPETAPGKDPDIARLRRSLRWTQGVLALTFIVAVYAWSAWSRSTTDLHELKLVDDLGRERLVLNESGLTATDSEGDVVVRLSSTRGGSLELKSRRPGDGAWPGIWLNANLGELVVGRLAGDGVRVSYGDGRPNVLLYGRGLENREARLQLYPGVEPYVWNGRAGRCEADNAP
ncbi:MAG: hypothetical protein H6745_16750 [Deltaproteobacteria bacterium]|nr:hypothetical protein [Deltaproteobacteria bacterium]